MKPLIADLHTHSLLSGHAFGTIREMAAGAAERGLAILGITEHGPSIPGTVNPIYFRNLIDAPRRLNGVDLLYGCEVNVLEGGVLDLDKRHMDCLDYAVAGIHYPCYTNMGLVGNTDNVISCMENPKVKFISHPDCDTFPLDYPALVEAARATGTALEMNNSSLRKPHLRPGCVENYRKLIPLCMEAGVSIVINTDAHDPAAVGDFTLALNLLKTLDIDENLILNNSPEKVRAFLLGE